MRLIVASLLALILLPPAAALGQDPDPPPVETGPADPVAATTATLTGTVDPRGVATPYHFEYGTTTEYGLETAEQVAAGDDPVAVQATVEGLTPNTTYHYRLVAGEATGDDRTFQTTPPPANPSPPSIARLRVADRTATSARLTARITPNRAPTAWYMEWGTTTGFGNRTPEQVLPANTGGAVTVSAPLEGLTPRTRIYWRVVATNAAGTRRSGRTSFTTLRLLTGVTLDLFPPRTVWGRDVTLSGQVQGEGVNRLTVVLEQSAFPFDAGYHRVATARSSRTGTFRFPSHPVFLATRFRASVTTTNAGSATSPEVDAAVRPRVSLHRTRRTKRRQGLAGRANPGLPNGRAVLQRRTRRGAWVRVARKPLAQESETASSYRFRVRRLRRTAVYRVRVRPRDGGAHLSGTSRKVRVAQRERRR